MSTSLLEPAVELESVTNSIPTGLFIGGQWRESSTGRAFAVFDPGTAAQIAEVADASVEDAMAALELAVETQASWSAVAPRERGEILRRAFEEIMARQDELAMLITVEMGKPLAESRAEVAYGAEFLRWFAEEAVRIAGRWATSPAGDARMLTMRQPVGPCLLITPWNFPMAMATRKIGAALAAGCTAILKPASQTPLTSLELAAILDRAGLPAGVLSVVPTSRAGDLSSALMAHPQMRKVSFTGSTEVGRTLLGQAANTVLRTSMELGGNAAFVVFDDADLDLAVQGAMVAKMRNTGQSCTAANRFLVHHSVAAEFSRRLAGAMSSLTIGHGTHEQTQVGPLIDAKQRRHVLAIIDDAVAQGAEIEPGAADDVPSEGFYVTPTVLRDVPATADILGSEVFGPVAPVVSFSEEDEALAIANATEHGLVGFVYTENLRRAIRVAEALETGMVGVNRGIVSNPAAPFGGVKQSGIGREGGPEGIDEYLAIKYVALDP
jgi:succinate-semialdehyde dehydrogenase / glutarate-semialdehyde dehydrogenase